MKKYVSPIAEIMALCTEHAVLTASEIPLGGETGSFDTHALYDRTVEWEEDSDE